MAKLSIKETIENVVIKILKVTIPMEKVRQWGMTFNCDELAQIEIIMDVERIFEIDLKTIDGTWFVTVGEFIDALVKETEKQKKNK